MKWDVTGRLIGNLNLQRTLSVITMSDPKDQTTIVPHNQQPLVTRAYPSTQELEKVILYSADAQKQWAKVPLSERIAIANKFVVSVAVRLSSFLRPDVQRALSFQGRVQQDVWGNSGGINPADGEVNADEVLCNSGVKLMPSFPGPFPRPWERYGDFWIVHVT